MYYETKEGCKELTTIYNSVQAKLAEENKTSDNADNELKKKKNSKTSSK